MSETKAPDIAGGEAVAMEKRRAALKRLGRYAAVSAPAVTLLLAALGKPTKAVAATGF